MADSLTVDVKDLTGKKVGTVDLPAEWFDGEISVAAMHQVVTAQLAKARRGTAKTKTRAEVRGGGRKPWRQKGTGRARHGSIRSPQWVGGGVAHGRTGEENFTKRVNKKMKRAALRSALTDRAREGRVNVVRGLAFEAPRTKDAVAALEALEHTDVQVLVVLDDLDLVTVKSFRNLQKVHVLPVDQLNTYDVLNSDVVLFAEDALSLIGTGKRSSAARARGTEGEAEPSPAAPEPDPSPAAPEPDPSPAAPEPDPSQGGPDEEAEEVSA